MKLTEPTNEELGEIERFSYSLMHVSEIALIMQCDVDSFCRSAFTKGNPIELAIQRGYLRSKADVNRAVITAAASGSTPAIKDAIEMLKKYKLDIELNYENARHTS